LGIDNVDILKEDFDESKQSAGRPERLRDKNVARSGVDRIARQTTEARDSSGAVHRCDSLPSGATEHNVRG
jgi:hypothetical protein